MRLCEWCYAKTASDLVQMTKDIARETGATPDRATLRARLAAEHPRLAGDMLRIARECVDRGGDEEA